MMSNESNRIIGSWQEEEEISEQRTEPTNLTDMHNYINYI